MSTATDFYQASRQAIEQQLYGTFATVEAAGQEYAFGLWKGEQLPDRLIAYDTETRLIEGREIPQLALATVCGSEGSSYLLHADDIGRFIRQHAQAFYACHNAVFDFWVTAQHLAGDPTACACWWAIAGDGRLCCTMLLDELIQLARIDAMPINRNLAVVAKEYCGIELDKSDPYRLRYGELIGLPATAWPDQEPGFWQYAAKDPVATLLVMQEQGKIARQLIDPYRGELLPGAERKFGPLTACLQVQGAIALDYASRTGTTVDVQRAEQLHGDIGTIVEQCMQDLEQAAPDVPLFKRYKRGERAGRYKLTKSGTAQRDTKAIKQRLLEIAQGAEELIRPPRLKNGSISDAARFWSEYTAAHPFIAAYCRFIEQAKLLQFFAKLKQPQVFPKYRPLVKTGRTSCGDPNLQQLPRDPRFRAMILAPPGYQLLQIDYAVLELRTLAAICLRRFGRSRLADLFAAGADPHKHTAAQLLGLTTEQFEALPKPEQKQHRQRAKAINFGVPGGMGADALIAYAKYSYGAELTYDQAKQFRDKLTRQIYPELQAYLQDQPYAALAINLHCTEAAARQAFGQLRQIKVAWAIVAGETESKPGDPYAPELITHIWRTVQQLNCNEQLQADLAAEQPSLELSRRIFWGSAATLTGRLRGHVGFTQRANSPFQGLAADGNKLALFRLLRAGYRVCGFVHDEMLILIPNGADYDRAVEQVQQILADAMAELTPGVPIASEYLLADRWYKGVDDQPCDAAGRIVPYTAAPAEQSALQSEIDAIWKDA